MSEHEQKEDGTNPDEEANGRSAGGPWGGGQAEVGSGDNPGGTGGGETAESGEDVVEKDPVAVLEAEVVKWKDLALRSQADLENFRKRMTRDRQEGMRYANSGLLESLVPILDNFEMGLEAARAESEKSMVFQGMSMVMNQIRGFLEDLGVTEIEAAGKVFDAKVHEAMAQEASGTVPEGEIVRVMRRGYKLHDRLLRAPAVVVSTGPEGGGEEG